MDADLYTGLAEVAIVFAGFAGISAVLSRRDVERWGVLYARRLYLMIEVSLVVALLALLPLALAGLGISGAVTWALCSLALAAFLVVLMLRVVRNIGWIYRGEEDPGEREKSAWMVVSIGGTLAVIAIQLLNALGLGFHREGGPYFSGLVFGLFMAARLFIRSLSRLRIQGPDDGAGK